MTIMITSVAITAITFYITVIIIIARGMPAGGIIMETEAMATTVRATMVRATTAIEATGVIITMMTMITGARWRNPAQSMSLSAMQQAGARPIS